MNTLDARANDAVCTVILEDVRSLYNVGAVMRVCDGAGVRRLIVCGITPYPSQGLADPRRGPVAARADRELRKTAIAAYDTVRVEHAATAAEAIARVRGEGAMVVAAEATPGVPSIWDAPALGASRLAVVFGHETEGISAETLHLVDAVVRIPMYGAGGSLNVATAVAVVLYEVVRRQSRGS